MMIIFFIPSNQCEQIEYSAADATTSSAVWQSSPSSVTTATGATKREAPYKPDSFDNCTRSPSEDDEPPPRKSFKFNVIYLENSTPQTHQRQSHYSPSMTIYSLSDLEHQQFANYHYNNQLLNQIQESNMTLTSSNSLHNNNNHQVQESSSPSIGDGTSPSGSSSIVNPTPPVMNLSESGSPQQRSQHLTTNTPPSSTPPSSSSSPSTSIPTSGHLFISTAKKSVSASASNSTMINDNQQQQVITTTLAQQQQESPYFVYSNDASPHLSPDQLTTNNNIGQNLALNHHHHQHNHQQQQRSAIAPQSATAIVHHQQQQQLATTTGLTQSNYLNHHHIGHHHSSSPQSDLPQLVVQQFNPALNSAVRLFAPTSQRSISNRSVQSHAFNATPMYAATFDTAAATGTVNGNAANVIGSPSPSSSLSNFTFANDTRECVNCGKS